MCTKHLCGAAQAARMVEKFHGDEMNFDASEFGVRDKYEKAMMVAMVMTESMGSVITIATIIAFRVWSERQV